MKVLKLRIENFRGIEAAEVAPDGSSVTVAGSNGAGKTSVIDAIVFALTGTAEQPVVHAGAERAEVELAVGDFIVKRSAGTTGKDRLTVRSKDGAVKATPQTFLDSMIGAGLAFDPLRFETMKPAEQVNVLMRGVGIEVAAIDRQRADLYATRTDIGRRKKEADAEVSALSTPENEAAPDDFDPTDMQERAAMLRAASSDYQRAGAALVAAKDRLARRRAELEQAEAALKAAEQEAAGIESEWLNQVDPTDELAAAERELAEAATIGARVERKRRLNARRTDAARLAAEYSASTEKIEAIDAGKRASIAGANLGIENLDVTEAGIVVDGLPLRSLNRAARVRIGLRIAARLTPKLRVVLVDEGSALDTSSMEDLVSAASELDLQVWIARVADGAALRFDVWEAGT